MDINETKPDQRPWRIIGRDNSTSISIAPGGGVKVQAAGRTVVIPFEVAMVLQSEEARRFIADPAVAPFLYAASERESRLRAAKMIAEKDLTAKRRDFVHKAVKIGVSEPEAWALARLKFPTAVIP